MRVWRSGILLPARVVRHLLAVRYDSGMKWSRPEISVYRLAVILATVLTISLIWMAATADIVEGAPADPVRGALAWLLWWTR